MKIETVRPKAETLLEAMRAMGYSVGTALADIIDNSIAAGAKQVSVTFRDRRICEPYLAVLDNGHGMTERELVEAMRHGSRHPTAQREEHDLGRFGLGMKTASQSQCRVLTVISLRAGSSQIVGARWDLDFLKTEAEWNLQLFTESDLLDPNWSVPQDELQVLRNAGHGTLVLWQQLDRLTAGLKNDAEALTERICETAAHLGLVFHRFLEGGADRRIELDINNQKVAPRDPFLSSSKKIWEIGSERISVSDGVSGEASIDVEAWVLPSIGGLTESQLSELAGNDGLRKGQGFYVYRADRLVVWGTWFRMVRQEELTKLARIKVDIPNSLDHLWSLDIRKSSAMPPEVVRDRLKAVVARVKDKARRVVTFTGRDVKSADALWTQRFINDRTFQFVVNRDHPLLKSLQRQVDEGASTAVDRYLTALELAIPYTQIYALMGGDRRALPLDELDDARIGPLLALAQELFDTLIAEGIPETTAVDQLTSMQPFCLIPSIIPVIRKALISRKP